MVFYETFKHKFDVKKLESERLLTRVEELSQINGSLDDMIKKQKYRNTKLEKNLNILREKLDQLKSNSLNINGAISNSDSGEMMSSLDSSPAFYQV